jgi:Tfp pilus assembly protein PilF
MPWVKIAIAGFQFLAALIRMAESAKARKQGADEAIAAGLAAALKGMQDAQVARENVRKRIDADPNELRSDDGFRR